VDLCIAAVFSFFNCLNLRLSSPRSAMLQRDQAIGSVSVRPSHTAVDSKLMTAGSCGFHATWPRSWL